MSKLVIKDFSFHNHLISGHLAAEQASRQEALQRGERVAQASEGEECLPGEASGAFTVYNPEEGSEEAKFHAGDTGRHFLALR